MKTHKNQQTQTRCCNSLRHLFDSYGPAIRNCRRRAPEYFPRRVSCGFPASNEDDNMKKIRRFLKRKNRLEAKND